MNNHSFGVPITVESSLTPGFFQKFASTRHSSFMGAFAMENDSKNTYKLKTYQIWAELLGLGVDH